MGGVSMKARKDRGESTGTGGTHGVPSDGWIRTMRHAKGVSLRQLGSLLGIQGNSVHVAERREIEGGISLYQLRRIAAALDCELFYAFVPRHRGERPSKRYAAQLAARAAEAAGAADAMTAAEPEPVPDGERRPTAAK